ncbi:5e56255c-5369-4cf7-8a4d-540511509bbf [Sclerotinia trifoliorum]|uniref:5e56255c-5369-4cf7-8a4d-540511509bbf n=1 Tax=Sclerotinia trifoliorum TaxID=28548 RepID=A0A8H2VNL1_9HELO|nr:5e56255c-5369-4cf7-8a4d-540511509bbf [Sclerotinia trifoliorum]
MQSHTVDLLTSTAGSIPQSGSALRQNEICHTDTFNVCTVGQIRLLHKPYSPQSGHPMLPMNGRIFHISGESTSLRFLWALSSRVVTSPEFYYVAMQLYP